MKMWANPALWAVYASLLTLGFALLYRLVRPRFKIRVNCWFCQTDQWVKYRKRNAFVCGQCGQYNGFRSDGDYNKWEDERWMENPNSTFARRDKNSKFPDNNGLCVTCNMNQTLKMHQLSKFQPKVEENFDAEIDEYQAHLEKTYRLCRKCEAVLHQCLGEQDSWLKPKILSWKLEQSRQTITKSAQLIKETFPSSWLDPFVLVRVIHVIMAFYLLTHYMESFNSTSEYVTPILTSSEGIELLISMTLTSFAIFGLEKRDFKDNVAALFSWTTVLVTYNLLSSGFIGHHIMSFACVGNVTVTLWNLLRRRVIRTGKDLGKSPNKNGNVSYYNTQQPEIDPDKEEICTQDLLTPTELMSNNSAEGSQLNINEDLHPCDISTLSLDDDDADREVELIYKQKKGSPVFSLKNYNGKSEINFGGQARNTSTSLLKQRSIVKPARFQPGAQSQPKSGIATKSWVAGGYWDTKKKNLPGANGENLSRASSQSSGFVSYSGGGQDLFNGQLEIPTFGASNGLVNRSLFDDASRLDNSFNFQDINNTLIAGGYHGSELNFPRKGTSSLSSSIDRLTQEAFADIKPTAKSSPKIEDDVSAKKSTNFLNKEIRCSVSSLIMLFSVAVNVAGAVYLAINYK